MAAAEARAVCQRTCNRCFVQEDAKRAPKLACCQSSCATSKSVDTGPASAADESDYAAANVTHSNKKSSFSNVAPDCRWWLHLQPSYGYQKGFTYEQLNALENEVETLKATDENKTYDYSWIEGDKAEPWWRTSDRDELASFVSQKSLNHIENCDLPPPLKKHLRGHPCDNISDDRIKTASFAKSSCLSSLAAHAKGSSGSGLIPRKQDPSANEGLLYFASDKSSSYTTIHEDVTENEQIFEADPSKAQLMEALCYSQTRAREAEEAAKQAYAEKEHIVTLFFKQASQLFAYKQWFQLLQLETLYIQIKNKDQVALPSMSYEGRKPQNRKQKFASAKQGRQGNPKCDITTYAVAFALGLSLVGAGLLLGWTVGWMLPRL